MHFVSNRDDQETNSIDPTDDVMTVAAVLWVALRTGLFIETFVKIPYRYMIPKISNTN